MLKKHKQERRITPQQSLGMEAHLQPPPRLEPLSSDSSSMKKQLAHLTTEEERAREKALDFYRYVGKSEVDADRLAWADIQKGFPRLNGYDGAEQ
jgi:hypothetical protein